MVAHSLKHVALGVALSLATAAAGSAQTGPGFSKSPGPSWIIVKSFNSVPGDWIGSVFHVKLANNRPGTWTTTLTVGKLPAFFGGDGSSAGVASGVFDPFGGTFQINTECKALNSSRDDLHLTLSPDGLWAVFDRPDGVWLGARKAVGTAFAAPVKVAGLGGATYPALGSVGRKMKVFFSDTKNILMQDIDLPNAKVLGTPVVVCRPVQARAKPISPTPLVGGDGDVEALLLAEVTKPKTGPGTGDADMVWANDLDPLTPAVVWIQRTDWTCCGGVAGGFLYYTHDLGRPIFEHLMHSEGAWLLGDDESVGGTANIDTGGVNDSAPSPLVSVVFLAARDTRPITVPGFNGAFAIDLLTLVPGPVLQTVSRDGVAHIAFPIPNNQALRGLRVALQGVVIELRKGTRTLTNTAWLRIR